MLLVRLGIGGQGHTVSRVAVDGMQPSIWLMLVVSKLELPKYFSAELV
jgi:hypothetical protein